MFPPHLPPPSSSVRWHRKLGRLKILLVATVVGISAGLAGAAIMLGWIWPGAGGGDVWVSAHYQNLLQKYRLNEDIKSSLAGQVFSVYTKASYSGGVVFLSDEDRIGEAATLAADEGWLVMKNPPLARDPRGWQAKTEGGGLRKIEKAIHDRRAGVIYLKMSASSHLYDLGTKAMTVAIDAQKLQDIFVFEDGEWQRAFVEAVVFARGGSQHLASVSAKRYILDRAYSPGSMAVTDSGALLGFVVNGKEVLPAAEAIRPWQSAVARGAPAYPSLGVEGWYGGEIKLAEPPPEREFFLVNRVVESAYLRRGDIITKVNGQPIAAELIWKLAGEKDVALTVWRGGKSAEVKVKLQAR